MGSSKRTPWWQSLTSGPALLIYLVLGAGVIVVAVWLIPQWLVSADAVGPSSVEPLTTAERVEAIITTRQLMLFAAGGLLAVVGIIFTWRRDRTSRALAELERDANFTTRYTEAIAQVGNEGSLAIRLGGIYALERIALDSDRDRTTILEVLAAFLRVQGPPPPDSDLDEGLFQPVVADVAAAARVLARITQLSSIRFPVNLAGAYLVGAKLMGARLSAADLSGANLTGADLSFANLTGARMVRTNFAEASMLRVDMTGAFLPAANFAGAQLKQSNLMGAELNGVVLRGARCEDVNFSHAYLIGADLSGADLSGAILSDAVLQLDEPEGRVDLVRSGILPPESLLAQSVKTDGATIWPEGFFPLPAN